MTMLRKAFLLLLAGLLSGVSVRAQFFQSGADPFGRWSTLRTPHYRIIYP